MARAPKSSLIEPLSWEKVDPDYGNRLGYDADFLGRRVSSPALGPKLKKTATLAPLAYEHFSVLLNPKRKLALWTAVNIDGASNRRLATRKADAWWVDRREPGTHIPHQVTNTFYKGSGFERGHLVRRLDPAWGSSDSEAARGEADSFHFSNCTPQVPKLNKQWWAKVENHVLDTANANDARLCVFSGCLFTDEDPVFRNIQIPLAYWKVVAWTTGKGESELRSLAFFVKQDEAVAKLINAPGIGPLSVEFEKVPAAIQGYQTTVAELQKKTGLSFGALANDDIDVYARKRAARLAPLAFHAVDVFQRLRKPSDLITQ